MSTKPPPPSFDWLPDKAMLRVADVVAATGMQTTFVEEWFAEKCHRFGQDERARPPMRIPRAFVIELLITSAKYSAEEKRNAVAACFPEFGTADLLWLRGEIDARLAGDKRANAERRTLNAER